jgi:hypothetical protein
MTHDIVSDGRKSSGQDAVRFDLSNKGRWLAPRAESERLNVVIDGSYELI